MVFSFHQNQGTHTWTAIIALKYQKFYGRQLYLRFQDFWSGYN